MYYNQRCKFGSDWIFCKHFGMGKIARRQKWFSQDDDLKEQDVVYFKLEDSVLSSKWHISKVEYVLPSRDTRTRKVGISYKHDTEDGSRKLSIVDRPVRQVVKLCNIDDTSLLDDIAAVRKAAKKIIDDRKVVTQKEIQEIITIEEKSIDKIPSQEIIDAVPSPVKNDLNLSPSPSLLLKPITIGYAVNVDTEEKQHGEQGRKRRVTEGLADLRQIAGKH